LVALLVLALLAAGDAAAAANRKLNPALAGGEGDVRGASRLVDHPFLVSPDGSRVVYVADQDTDEVVELYSVPIEGGEAVKLNRPLAPGGNVGGADAEVDEPFQISPDGKRVVYVADQDADEVFEIYSVPIEGGPVVKLNPPLVAGGDVRGADEAVVPFRISPDSSRVVYLADLEADEVIEIYSVAIEGGKAVKLNPPLAGGKGDVRGASSDMANPFRISPDSARVVYVADQETDNVYELFSVAIEGGAAVKLNPRLAKGRGEVRGADNSVANPFRFTPDGGRVLYLADQKEVGVMELYAVAVTGGPVTRLNLTLADGRGAVVGADYELDNPFLVSPDGRFAVYVADQDADEVIELYSSELP
jgi:Tol biopolymer transport system component